MKNFKTDDLLSSEITKSEDVANLVAEIVAAERQAIAIAQEVNTRHHLQVETLAELVTNHQLPPVKLPLVVAYLAGYMSGETFDSEFDTSVFGEATFMRDDKPRVVGSALVLATLLMEKLGTDLPDRRPPPKPKRQRSKTAT